MKSLPENSNYDIAAMTEVLVAASCEIGIELGQQEIRLFQEYCRELVFWNQKMNLVSAKTLKDIPVRHFVDSLTAAEYIANRDILLDIGSGAGFPGIPLKIVRPHLKVTLLEASRRKASFLKEVARRLGLGDIEVVNSRVEDLLGQKNYRGSFNVVISRAALKLPEFLRLGAGFISSDGILIAMKGPGVETETRASVSVLKDTGLKLSSWRAFRLPISGEERKLLIFQRA